MKKKFKVYIETFIVSHLDTPDRPDWMAKTRTLWKSIVAGKYHVVIVNLKAMGSTIVSPAFGDLGTPYLNYTKTTLIE